MRLFAFFAFIGAVGFLAVGVLVFVVLFAVFNWHEHGAYGQVAFHVGILAVRVRKPVAPAYKHKSVLGDGFHWRRILPLVDRLRGGTENQAARAGNLVFHHISDGGIEVFVDPINNRLFGERGSGGCTGAEHTRSCADHNQGYGNGNFDQRLIDRFQGADRILSLAACHIRVVVFKLRHGQNSFLQPERIHAGCDLPCGAFEFFEVEQGSGNGGAYRKRDNADPEQTYPEKQEHQCKHEIQAEPGRQPAKQRFNPVFFCDARAVIFQQHVNFRCGFVLLVTFAHKNLRFCGIYGGFAQKTQEPKR